MIWGHQIINLTKNKVDIFSMQIKGLIDVLMVYETKLDDSSS